MRQLGGRPQHSTQIMHKFARKHLHLAHAQLLAAEACQDGTPCHSRARFCCFSQQRVAAAPLCVPPSSPTCTTGSRSAAMTCEAEDEVMQAVAWQAGRPHPYVCRSEVERASTHLPAGQPHPVAQLPVRQDAALLQALQRECVLCIVVYARRPRIPHSCRVRGAAPVMLFHSPCTLTPAAASVSSKPPTTSSALRLTARGAMSTRCTHCTASPLVGSLNARPVGQGACGSGQAYGQA